MKTLLKVPRPSDKREKELRHSNYPNILTLLSAANHPLPTNPREESLPAIIDFRSRVGGEQEGFRFLDISMGEAVAAIDSSPDVLHYTFNAPEILAIQSNGARVNRQPQILAFLTCGTRILIEILPEGAIDETAIEVSGVIARNLPHFGLKYMVVFPCQFRTPTDWRPL